MGALTIVALGACGLGAAAARAASVLSWSSSSVDAGRALSAISCPTESLCVSVDSAGGALTSTDPASTSAGWARASIDSPRAMTSISCPTESLCVAVDAAGNVLASTDPASPGAHWSAPSSIDSGERLTAISCPTESLCVAVDPKGNALSSSSPGTPGSSGWTRASIDPGHALSAISCTDSACAAVDSAGGVLTSSDPTGGAGAWRAIAIDPAGAISGISCAASLGCVAVGDGGAALASADPSVPAPTWSATSIGGGRSLTGVSCSLSGLCVAVGANGEALASDDPTASLPLWGESSADPSTAIAGISCLPGGFCVAVDGEGRVLRALVQAPSIAVLAPDQVSATGATLTTSVDPHDATLLSCKFEYGTSASYGQSAPCASTPSPAGGPQAVLAPISELLPNTTYHYRLLASSAAGTVAGPDQSFATPLSSQVAIVYPHPSITGTPAVGERLTCHPGVPAGTSARVSYSWLRDEVLVLGATGSIYEVRGIDTGHHLQCVVSTSDGGGGATARSPFVTVPVQGVLASVGETSVGRARASASRVSVPIGCSAQALRGCEITLRLSAVETISGRRIVAIAARTRSPRRSARAGALRRMTVALGFARISLAAGQHLTVSVLLNATARRLLVSRRRLPMQLAVSGTVIGVIEAALATQTLEPVLASSSASRHGR